MDPETRNQREGGDRPHRVAVGAEDPPEGKMLPVWFFVGIIFLIYGVIILITGLLEIHHPPATVLAAELHPTIWWGAILTALGGFYVLYFGPWKS
jgi:hypothetical protein